MLPTNAGLLVPAKLQVPSGREQLKRYTPLKLTWQWKITIFNGRYIFLNGGFSIVMLVFQGVHIDYSHYSEDVARPFELSLDCHLFSGRSGTNPTIYVHIHQKLNGTLPTDP